jgi:transketolase C-terminal domain/subunit
VAEDHYRAGGIGEMLSSAIENTGLNITRLCVSKIPHSGTKDQLLEKHKINWQHITLAVRSMKGIK